MRNPNPTKAWRKAKRKLMYLISLERLFSQTELSKHANLSKGTVSIHLSDLRKQGVVVAKDMSGFMVHFLTPKGRQMMSLDMGDRSTTTKPKAEDFVDRPHNVKFKATWKAPADVHRVLDNTLRMDRGIGVKRWTKAMEGAAVQFYPKTLLIHMKSFYAPLGDVDRLILEKVTGIVEELKRQYPGMEIGDPQVTVRQYAAHHALQGDEYAKMCVREGISIEHLRGKLNVDASDGAAEIEAVHGKTSYEDAVKYANVVVDVMEDKRVVPKVEEWVAVLDFLKTMGGAVQTTQQIQLQHVEEIMALMLENGRQILAHPQIYNLN